MVAIFDIPDSEARREIRKADEQLLAYAGALAFVGSVFAFLFTFNGWLVPVVLAVCGLATIVGLVGNRLRLRSRDRP